MKNIQERKIVLENIREIFQRNDSRWFYEQTFSIKNVDPRSKKKIQKIRHLLNEASELRYY